MSGQDFPVSTRTLTVLVYAITGGWILNLAAPLFISSYSGNISVNGIMGALLGMLGAWRHQRSRTREPLERADSGGE